MFDSVPLVTETISYNLIRDYTRLAIRLRWQHWVTSRYHERLVNLTLDGSVFWFAESAIEPDTGGGEGENASSLRTKLLPNRATWAIFSGRFYSRRAKRQWKRTKQKSACFSRYQFQWANTHRRLGLINSRRASHSFVFSLYVPTTHLPDTVRYYPNSRTIFASNGTQLIVNRSILVVVGKH